MVEVKKAVSLGIPIRHLGPILPFFTTASINHPRSPNELTSQPDPTVKKNPASRNNQIYCTLASGLGVFL